MTAGLVHMPIFYINLANRPERRAYMEAQFQSLGIAAERIEAVTPADLSAGDRNNYCNPERRRWMTALEFACNRSHQAAWQRLLVLGASHGLILEDDAVLSRSLPKLLAAIDRDEKSPSVLRIETLAREPRRMGPVEREILPGVGLRRCYTRDAGTGGYILTRQAATLLIGRPELNTELIDAVLFNPFTPLAKSLDVLYCDPALSIQQSVLGEEGPEARSDLESSRDEKYRERKKRPMLKWAHKIQGWIEYDAVVAVRRIQQLGRRDIRDMVVGFRAD